MNAPTLQVHHEYLLTPLINPRLPDPDFWRERCVLVTGHTGFKGSWLCAWLHTLGAQIHGLALDPEPGGHFEKAGISALMASDSRGDIRSPEFVAKVIKASQPEVVIHMAAQALVRPGYDDPLATFGTNALGTANVLHACRGQSRLQALVAVTTDKCYRNNGEPWPYRENDPLGGTDPYSASKACAELIAASYRQSYFSHAGATPIATARAGNVIGGGDVCRDRLLPDLFRAISAKEPLTLRQPRAVRPWQHVLDALNGYLVLAQALARSQTGNTAFNFGPSNDTLWPVGQVVELALSLWGSPTQTSAASTDLSRRESISLRLDSSLAQLELGWKPLLTTEQAIGWTVNWERAVHQGGDALAVTLHQIQSLMAFRAPAYVA